MSISPGIEPRARILDTADRLFYSEGIRATGTEKIMEIADVAKATFYRHFASKDALVLAYLDQRDQAFWQHLLDPVPPEDIHEALARIQGIVNHPRTTSCPFLRVASEYPETTHPFHCRVIEHKNKMFKYLTGLLKPLAVDEKAMAAKLLTVIDGALSVRMVYGVAKEVPLLATAEAILQGLSTPGNAMRATQRPRRAAKA